MKSQLFTSQPDTELIIKCINVFGWTSLDDNRYIFRNDLNNAAIITQHRQLLPELIKYYFPCKFNKYLTTLTVKTCITITRQLLRTIGYNIEGSEKVIKAKKDMVYGITKIMPKPAIAQLPPQTKLIINWN